ncbi:MAG TPA: growth inhibitor PemK [Stellaceae bacterium]|nr:growth inhibitor PemK [Stellaceae bacterium]
MIAAVSEDASGRLEIAVAPVTHAPPAPPAAGVEIPPRVKHHLGLDDERSWVIATDLNVFLWPGVDLRPVPNAPAGTFDYGFLPPRLFGQIRQRIVAAGAVATRRSE